MARSAAPVDETWPSGIGPPNGDRAPDMLLTSPSSPPTDGRMLPVSGTLARPAEAVKSYCLL